jgi:hypothetical protein
MALDRNAAKQRIKAFDFSGLFTQELGWDHHRGALTVHLADRDVVLNAVAEKRGFAVWHCPAPSGQKLPDSASRRRIERELTKAAHEHILIFTDATQLLQVWQWVRREAGKPTRVRETLWTQHQSGELLVQKLERLFVSLDEEERLTLPDVTSRAAGNVDERVTKRFYEEFRKQHALFLKFITGIPNQGDHEWYASVMLNRLMFLYFIQRKGFLDGDPEYLRNRLRKTKAEHGKDKFYNFYRYFLLKLFHGGLNTRPPRQANLEKLLGRVPYLNGGIFDVHQLERTKAEGGYGPDIQMPDKAFETIFDYFDRYQWHLDERPLRADNEINPDVLGYIFEKYVNQKQMGAYYTKEDITDYIGKNTILPFLFDSARNRCKSAFDGPNSVWVHLQQEPDRYIYPAVRHGISWNYIPGHPNLGEPLDKPRELPAEIAKGLDTSKPNLIERRKDWNKPAPADFGLPTEIWRETVARRQRCEELRAKLAAGEVHDINDFITLNLDIRRFAQDVISRCDSPDLLAALWHSLAGRPPRKSDERPQHGITILDPTCGSGAFLFAALNILEPLYEACLDRMEGLLADARIAKGADWKPPLYSHLAEFERVLNSVAKHPNERYFIYKTIILHNLYGVDIMEEAVEICKLRLFLKLAAQVEPDSAHTNLGIEPLPDIDFNIRAGNALVGYATRAELEEVGKRDLLMNQQVKEVLEAAEDAAGFHEAFIQSQITGDLSTAEFKRKLVDKFRTTRNQCDSFLAEDYRMGLSTQSKQFDEWKRSHQPFHWFVEFFGTISRGGFDVVIGNPPYVEMHKIKSYGIKHFTTIDSGNLYALCVERSSGVLSPKGYLGVIVPLSGFSTERTASYQNLIWQQFRSLFLSFYSGDAHPSVLFEGVRYRLSVIIGTKRNASPREVVVSDYLRWYADERPVLFSSKLTYQNCPFDTGFLRFAKVGTRLGREVVTKLTSQRTLLGTYLRKRGKGHITYHRSPVFWIRSMDFEPYFKSPEKDRSTDHIKDLFFEDKNQAHKAGALLNSSIFYLWFTVQGNCRNIAGADIESLPAGNLKSEDMHPVMDVFAELMVDLKRHSKRRVYIYEASGRVEYDEFYPDKSKSIIDRIDAQLANHYGLSVPELDFIINYDIKYRLGRNANDE